MVEVNVKEVVFPLDNIAVVVADVGDIAWEEGGERG
jgi:hypothetical protein